MYIYTTVVYFDNQLKQLLITCIPGQPATLALPCFQSDKASLQVRSGVVVAGLVGLVVVVVVQF